jgi:hypothetical protein
VPELQTSRLDGEHPVHHRRGPGRADAAAAPAERPVKSLRRCALSRWRRRRKYGRRLAVAERALVQEFALVASMLIDRRLVVLEAAA